jgi:hypothetical protein
VFVNRVASAPPPAALSAEALAGTGVRVTWIRSLSPLSPRDFVARAAPGDDEPCCIVPHALLGNVDLAGAFALARETGADVKVWCRGACLDVSVPGDRERPLRAIAAPGWLTTIRDEKTAHALVEATLAGRVRGIEVRGTPTSPGVFRARGSGVAQSAVVTGPCYLGPDSYVAAGAQVGPGAVLDAGAVVERGAEVSHARVAANVVVGQGVRVTGGCVHAGRIELHDGPVLSLDDDLLVGRRGGASVLASFAGMAQAAFSGPASLFRTLLSS